MKDEVVHRDHITERMIIYEANVDKEIVPIVRWLNSLQGILTRWSCEEMIMVLYLTSLYG